MLMSHSLVPVNVTLHGNKVFADVIKLSQGHTKSGRIPNPVELVAIQGEERETEMHTEGNTMRRQQQRLDLCSCKPRNANKHQKLKRKA